jgi:TctA family transporter
MTRSHSIFRSTALGLVVAFLLMVGATTGAAVAHDLAHAGHHGAGMHGQGICAWMCVAGQGQEADSVSQDSALLPYVSLNAPSFDAVSSLLAAVILSRGPPLRST